MDRQSGTEDSDEDAPGRRLERYIKARWTRRKGGMLGLAKAIGASTETIYGWFRGDAEPSMGHLRLIADQLGVRRAVLVAVLDGDPLPGETDGGGAGVQRDAVTDLVAVIRPLIDQTLEGIEPRLRALESEVRSHHGRPATEGSPERRAPHETAG